MALRSPKTTTTIAACFGGGGSTIWRGRATFLGLVFPSVAVDEVIFFERPMRGGIEARLLTSNRPRHSKMICGSRASAHRNLSAGKAPAHYGRGPSCRPLRYKTRPRVRGRIQMGCFPPLPCSNCVPQTQNQQKRLSRSRSHQGNIIGAGGGTKKHLTHLHASVCGGH